MKISRNLLKNYLNFELPDDTTLVATIGAQLGEVETVNHIGDRYVGIIIVRVVSCEPVVDSDHLQLCIIDDNQVVADVERTSEGFVQIVCGAPNVRAGILVAWLPPGSTVPASYDTEPFVLEARTIRGAKSSGMLASPKELAIGDNHDGILELEADAIVGALFADAYQLDDTIIDIENKMFTHRPDLFGQLGVAREISGIFGYAFESPDWYKNVDLNAPLERASSSLPLHVTNELPNLVPRFMAAVVSGVDGAARSPVWLQTQLSRIGIRPISLLVDITNYMMTITAQPLHAYDYDKVAALSSNDDGAHLVIRNPHAEESLPLLNGKTIQPRPAAIMIATDSKSIGIGGVMGGTDTEVDDSTRNIIVEVATFDMYSIRRTSMSNGLFSDAVTRFNKGQSPLQNAAVLARTLSLLRELTKDKAQLASDIIDLNDIPEVEVSRSSLHRAVSIDPAFVNDRLGLDLSLEQMATLLRNVEMSVTEGDHIIEVTAPFWRTDIELREDIVEEIGRLYGYDKLPLILPNHDITPVSKNEMLTFMESLRQTLRSAGANEVLNYSFVHGQLLKKVGQSSDAAFKLSNALSPDLQYYRLTITPSLLAGVHANIKAGYHEFAVYEIGKGHEQPIGDRLSVEHEVPYESTRMALVFSADARAAKHYSGAAFYQARKYLTAITDQLGLTEQLHFQSFDESPKFGFSNAHKALYRPGRRALIMIGELSIGDIGEYSSAAAKGLKLPPFCAGFELDLEALLPHRRKSLQYQSIPRYPQVSQDLCLRVSQDLPYEELANAVSNELHRTAPVETVFSVEAIDIFSKPEEADKKQVTFRIRIASYQKTMTDHEASQLLGLVSDAARKQCNAETI